MILGDLAEVQMGYPFRSRLEHDPMGEVAVVQMKDIDVANLVRVDQVDPCFAAGGQGPSLASPWRFALPVARPEQRGGAGF